ncbi:hypothetical protein B0H16DRAFT_1474975 [Mycena metata]|uniref:Ribonuclease H1 N-terminal domain-containing protein n=1 Tax=Mycena metata TaxID=1033252 RepID=A0AAD7HFJ8_9AGAR|nr:hypothetical protein B0H16DRAFT_1474975 [Mycena metata]
MTDHNIGATTTSAGDPSSAQPAAPPPNQHGFYTFVPYPPGVTPGQHGPQTPAVPAAPAPAPAGVPPPAPLALIGGLPAGLHVLLRYGGPWSANAIYKVVPTAPLSPVEEITPAPEWYAITRGRFVGVIDQYAMAHWAIRGVSNCAHKSYTSQVFALDAFNKAIGWNGVEVVPCSVEIQNVFEVRRTLFGFSALDFHWFLTIRSEVLFRTLSGRSAVAPQFPRGDELRLELATRRNLSESNSQSLTAIRNLPQSPSSFPLALLSAMPSLSVAELACLLTSNNPNPWTRPQMEALTDSLTIEELQQLVDLLGMGSLSRAIDQRPDFYPRLVQAQARLALTSPDDDDEIEALYLAPQTTASPASTPVTPPAVLPMPVTPATPPAVLPLPVTPVAPPPVTPTKREPIYKVVSPDKKGLTTSWLDAGHASQNVPGGSVRKVASASKARKPRPAAYAVFFGHTVATFTNWDAARQSAAAPRSYQCGFASLQEANAALAYARSKGWTGDSVSPQIPVPIPSSYTPNALNSPNPRTPRTWYVVSCGINPGIYSSGLENHINISGVRGALYKSFTSQAAVEEEFAAQLSKNQIVSRARSELFEGVVEGLVSL